MAEGNHLRGWKAIADFLDTSVRTAIRWEEGRGLPIHRLPGGSRDSVYALPEELEAWQRSAAGRGESAPAREFWGAAQPGESPRDLDATIAAPVAPTRDRGRRWFRDAAWGLAVVAVAICAIWIVGGPWRGRARQAPDPRAERRAGGHSVEPAPIALQYVRLDISRPDGWKVTLDVPDGGVGQTGGSPDYPLLVFRPRLVAAGLMLEIARADGRPMKPQASGAPPMVIVLEPDAAADVLQPYRFRVRWVTPNPPSR